MTRSDPAMALSPARAPRIACRRMADTDIDSAVGLLTRGFPERAPDYWRQGLTRMRDRRLPGSVPQFGYVMTADGRLVGIVLLIFSESNRPHAFANVSSWFVEPDYRGFSSALLAFVFRLKDTVLFNISPSPHTLSTIEAQGFSRYCDGTFHALPALGRPVRGAQVREVAPDGRADASPIARLASYGCRCFEVDHEGMTYPFAFRAQSFVGGRLPGTQLIYCRSRDEFVRFAGPLGRALARGGILSVMLGADGPVPGLIGVYRAGRRLRYFRGAMPPPLDDLSASELAIFGA